MSRTGYTGDLGYEIWVESSRAVELWDAMIGAGTPYGVTPAGVWALDIARIEAGLIMLDVDYFSSHHALIESRKSSPFEINLGWAVSAGKGPFNGRAALESERARGAAWGFIGLEIDWRSFESCFAAHGSAAARSQCGVAHQRAGLCRRRAGRLRDQRLLVAVLKQLLALSHLRAPYFRPGTLLEIEITVEHRRERAQAQVRALPFFDPERKKA